MQGAQPAWQVAFKLQGRPHREGRTTAPGALRAAEAEPPPTASTGAAPLSSRDTSSATSAGPKVIFLLQRRGRAGQASGSAGVQERVPPCTQHAGTPALRPTKPQPLRLPACLPAHTHLKGTAASSRRPEPGSSRNSKPFCRNTSRLSLHRNGFKGYFLLFIHSWGTEERSHCTVSLRAYRLWTLRE